MMVHRIAVWLLFCLFSLQASAQFSFLQQQEQFLPVEQAYQLQAEINDNKIVLIWQLANQYYLYQHGFEHYWLNEAGEKQAITVELPEGIAQFDEYFGDTTVYYHQVVLYLPLPQQKTVLQANSQGCADAGLCYPPYSLYFAVDPQHKTIVAIDKPQRSVATKTSAPVESKASLWLMLLSALVGGFILNLMPCVFPVLGIKVLQLTQGYTPAQRRWQGLVYLFGVVFSFVAVAALMLALRSAGSAIGWGFQLQNPWFIALLVYLFFILSLAMAGFVQLGQGFMGMGQSLTQSKSSWSSFFTGVLAVVVASPCTAPFMGAALGFAVAQSAWVALLVFAALGLGMAAPLAVLSFIPGWAKKMPKPGLWMERVKQFFAFPLVLTAVWLLWVLDNQVGSTAASGVLVGCVLLVFAFWCWRGGRVAKIFAALALILVVLLIPFAAPANQSKAQSLSFVSYSAKALADLRSQGTPVFVDLTADWCITCLANEKTVLHTDEIQQAFKQAGITYMVGDWTNYDEEITALIEQYQRSGIPLYLLYPADSRQAAIVLPQLLTKNIVLQAIELL